MYGRRKKMYGRRKKNHAQCVDILAKPHVAPDEWRAVKYAARPHRCSFLLAVMLPRMSSPERDRPMPMDTRPSAK